MYFSVQSYGKVNSQWRIFEKSPVHFVDSIFRNFLLSIFTCFAVLSTRKGKANEEVKKNLPFIFCLIERASALKKVKSYEMEFLYNVHIQRIYEIHPRRKKHHHIGNINK